MQTIKTYLYPNTAEVQIIDPAIFTVRNRIVYSRPIKVYQGIDNPIQVTVRNQDQKKYNLTGYALQVDIQDPTNKITVDSIAVTWANITQGLGQFTISSDLVNSMEQRFYKLTFKTIKESDNTEQPVYIDDNYGVPLDLEVLPAYYAAIEPSPAVNNGVLDGGTLEDDIIAIGGGRETIIDGGTL
jgi:hypothetical protein